MSKYILERKLGAHDEVMHTVEQPRAIQRQAVHLTRRAWEP